MANRTLNTRIKLRYASYAEWQASTIKLLPGEVAVCYIGANNEEIKNTAPTVLFKVGDGEHTFKDLQWASARAADVYDWAKAENRPEYSKADVGLANVRNVEQYSKNEVDDLISGIRGDLQVDTNTTYEFDLSKTNEITIYSKEKGADRVKVGTFAVSFEELENSINDAIGDIDAVLSEINGSGTTSGGGSSSGGSSETILQLDSIFMDVFNAYYGDETVDRIATSEEQTFFNNLINRLNSGEKISGIYTSCTTDMYACLYLTFESYIEGAGIYFNLSTGDIDSGIKKVTLAYSEGGNILITPTLVSSGSSGLNYVEYDIIIGDKYRERELDLNNINSCGSVYYNINANGLFDYVVPIKFATLTIGENNALIASSCSPFTDAAGFAKNIMFTLATSNTYGDVVAAYITFIKDGVRTAMWVQLNKGTVDIANQYVQLMGTLGIKIRLYY